MAPFAIMGSTRNVMQDARQTGLEQDQCILRRCDIPRERGFQHRSGAVHHLSVPFVPKLMVEVVVEFG
jgi:hypothetical protein